MYGPPGEVMKLGTPPTDPTEVWLPLNWYSVPGPLSATTCGLSASRFGWLVTC